MLIIYLQSIEQVLELQIQIVTFAQGVAVNTKL